MDKNASASLNNFGKREQVKKANKNIFLWVLGASVIIVICTVAATFLIRQAIFNQKIISQKSDTNKIVKQNIQTASELKKNVDSLIADSNLAVLKIAPTDSNLKVVFDALPTNDDTTALSNSIYSKVFGTAGVITESISVGDALATSSSTVPEVGAPINQAVGNSTAPVPVVTAFQGDVTGSAASIKNMFLNFERVIRPMNLNLLTIKAGGSGNLTVTLGGETYYVPADSVSLGKIQVKP
ncbi:MAG: hypothetical protein ABIR46_01755 [Candidatus Saccharimonadales bacterium]